MGESCENCQHRSCVNGESGKRVYGECIKCKKFMVLCSNDLTEEELDERCNGEACGCGDSDWDGTWICEDCR